MSEHNAYALWIIPDGIAHELIDGYIAKLSHDYGLPRFEPHVTLLGGIRFPEQAEMRKLVGNLNPFRVRLGCEVGYLDEYFRCLFLPANKTEELMDVFVKASQLFDRQNETYFPHLSLAYGGLSAQTKQEMIRELGSIPEIVFEAQAISLVHAAKETPVSEWRPIERFSLA